MYAFYIPRGHRLEDLENLDFIEKRFYQHAINKYYDDLFMVINTVAMSFLGNEKERQAFIEEMERNHG